MAVLAVLGSLAGTAAAGRTRWVSVHFTGPAGARESVIVAMPSWYGPDRHPPLPLVIAPHSRGFTPWQAAKRWGDLPGRFGVIVLNAGMHGRVIPRRSWAWPPAVAELTRLPEIVSRLLPYLRYDHARVYAAGFSMGGQEALMMLAQRPDLFAAVVAADPLTNLEQRWYQFPLSKLSAGEQRGATREVGATPRQRPWLYVRRSPLFFASTIAEAGVPLELWWNPADTVVIRGSTQAGALYHALKRIDPQAPVFARVHHEMHGWVFKDTHSLPAMLRFLLSHRQPGGRPADGFSYVSWRPFAAAWGWTFRATAPAGSALWRVSDVTSSGLRTNSPGPLLVAPPQRPATAFVDGRAAPVLGGVVAVPAGIHTVAFGYV